MVRSPTRSPYALFGFALAERDWALAGLIARSLEGGAGSRRRLRSELRRHAEAGAPATLNELGRWAELSRVLDIETEPG